MTAQISIAALAPSAQLQSFRLKQYESTLAEPSQCQSCKESQIKHKRTYIDANRRERKETCKESQIKHKRAVSVC